MDDLTSNSLNSFLRSYASDKFAWESNRHCCDSAAFWTAFGFGYDTPKKGYISSPSKRTLSESGSLSSGDMSISTDSSSEFMSCFSGHCADSCTSLSSSSSSAKIPMSVVGWLGLHDARQISTPDVVRSAESLEAEAYFLIYSWTLSLFVDVAWSALNCEPVDTFPLTPNASDATFDVLWTPGSPDRTTLIVTTKTPLFDLYEPSSPPAVKFASHNTVLAVDGSITGNTELVAMPNSVDYEAINPEQSVTARNVCMWGRRQERIPKVRAPGQTEAIYCFDERRLRQSQAVRPQQRREPTKEVRVGPFAITKGIHLNDCDKSWNARPLDTNFKCKPTVSNNASDTVARAPLIPRNNSYGGSNIPHVQKPSRTSKVPNHRNDGILRHPAGLDFTRGYRS